MQEVESPGRTQGCHLVLDSLHWPTCWVAFWLVPWPWPLWPCGRGEEKKNPRRHG